MSHSKESKFNFLKRWALTYAFPKNSNWEWGAGNNILVNTHTKSKNSKNFSLNSSLTQDHHVCLSLSLFFSPLSNKLQPTYFFPPQGALIFCLLWIKLESLSFSKLVLPPIISKQHYKDSGSEIQKKIKILFRRGGKDCYKDVWMDYVFTYIFICTCSWVCMYIYVCIYY